MVHYEMNILFKKNKKQQLDIFFRYFIHCYSVYEFKLMLIDVSRTLKLIYVYRSSPTFFFLVFLTPKNSCFSHKNEWKRSVSCHFKIVISSHYMFFCEKRKNMTFYVYNMKYQIDIENESTLALNCFNTCWFPRMIGYINFLNPFLYFL